MRRLATVRRLMALAGLSIEDQLEQVLTQAAGHERCVLLCSFQKEESVLLDGLARLGLQDRIEVVMIDTGALFAETLETWRRFEEHFGVSVGAEEAYAADAAAGGWTGPENCCGVEKVAALERALEGADAWVTGLRREMSADRAGTELVEHDAGHGIAKYNPLAHWTEKDIWRQINTAGLPYHPLHDQGYASIGCAPCTQPGSGREGRWAGTDKSECGLHVA